MAFSFWDFMQIAAPLAAGAVGTPAAGIAVGAAMQGARTKAEGGTWEDALKSAALGGATGAAGNALAPAMSGIGGAAARQAAEQTPEMFAQNLGAGLAEGGMELSNQQIAALARSQLAGKTASEIVGKEAGKMGVQEAFFENLKNLGNYAELGGGLAEMFRQDSGVMLGPQHMPYIPSNQAYRYFQQNYGGRRRPAY
jgi:hypothetical protein